MLHPHPASPVARSSRLPLWLRALSRLPWSMLYSLGALTALTAERVLRHRRAVVRANIAGSFPEIAQLKRRAIEHAYYRNAGDLLVEKIKATTLRPEELAERVAVRNLDVVQQLLAGGKIRSRRLRPSMQLGVDAADSRAQARISDGGRVRTATPAARRALAAGIAHTLRR